MTANLQERYVDQSGRLTLAGLKLFQGLARTEAKLAAIAAVAAPVGGATDDAEARTAINAIITAAG